MKLFEAGGVAALAIGELVGTYTESGDVRYTQTGSAFDSSSLQGAVDFDNGGASWTVKYAEGGQRLYQLSNGLSGQFANPLNSFLLQQNPGWSLGPQSMQSGTDSRNTAAAANNDNVVSWVDWDANSYVQRNGGNSTVTGTAGGVTVKFSGESIGLNVGNKGWNHSGFDYDGNGPFNAPATQTSEYISFNAGNRSGTVTFSQPVVNPVMALQSLGAPKDGAVLWYGNEKFDVKTTGTVGGGWGSGQIAEGPGGYVYNWSAEGNGIVQFYGIYTQIDWVIVDTEHYGNFTIGFDAVAPASGGLRLSSGITASGGYLGTVANDTASLVYKLGTENVRANQAVGYAPGYADFYGDDTRIWQHFYNGKSFNTDLPSVGWVGRDFNDEATSITFGNQTYKLTVYQHKDFTGRQVTFQANEIGKKIPDARDLRDYGFPDNELSGYQVWGYRYEDYKDYTYRRTTQQHNMYDQRVQLNYHVSTQTQDVTDWRPVYKTSTQMVKVETLKEVTVWRDEPVYKTVSQLVTEVRYDEVPVRSSSGAAEARPNCPDTGVPSGRPIQMPIR